MNETAVHIKNISFFYVIKVPFNNDIFGSKIHQ